MPCAKLAVPDLCSRGDEQRLISALLAIPGVFCAVASCETGFVEIDFEDDEAALHTLLETALHAGFPASLAG